MKHFLSILGLFLLLNTSLYAQDSLKEEISSEVRRFIVLSNLWIHDSCTVTKDDVQELLSNGLYNLRKINPQVVDKIRSTRLYGVLLFVDIRCGEISGNGGVWGGVPFIAGTVNIGQDADDRVLMHEFLHQFGFGGWREATTDECAYAALESDPQKEDYPLCSAFRFIF